MDNLCHTLAGAAFGEAGLKRTTRFASATLMIASNLPDVDALVFATDIPSVAVRRGWTHGILAQALLPCLLALTVWAIGRRRGARVVPLLLLSYVGVLSHVLMDLLNNYGVRLLMPFSSRWFYGDSVFIVDVWLWLALGAGVWLARRRGCARPARAALLVAAVYVGVLIVSARASRDYVADEWRLTHGRDPQALMVGPRALTPFSRTVIVDAGEEYATGTFTWFPRAVTYDPIPIPKNRRDAAVRTALAADARFPAVLTWARFPFYRIESIDERTIVSLGDVRFGERVGMVRAVVSASPGSSDPADRSR